MAVAKALPYAEEEEEEEEEGTSGYSATGPAA